MADDLPDFSSKAWYGLLRRINALELRLEVLESQSEPAEHDHSGLLPMLTLEGCVIDSLEPAKPKNKGGRPRKAVPAE